MVRAVKIPRLEGGNIGPRMETCVNCDGPISMVPCLQKEAKGMERPWCKHGTMEIGPSQFTQLSVLGPILPPSRQGILTARTVKCGYSTD